MIIRRVAAGCLTRSGEGWLEVSHIFVLTCLSASISLQLPGQ